MTRRRSVPFLLVFLVLALSVDAAETPKAPTGELIGRVTDEVGAPLPGALVTATQGGPQWTVLTDENGDFRLSSLAVGVYTVTCGLEGFATIYAEVEVHDGRATRIDCQLQATIEETIMVSSLVTASDVVFGIPAVPEVEGWYRRDFDTEEYERVIENRFRDPSSAPLSTFAVDVDSASFSNVRRFLEDGEAPPADAVRIEELLNAFPDAYDYPEPGAGAPFSVSVAVAAAPWKPEHRLVRIGLKGRSMERRDRPPANLVFLIDVSGSMDDEHKLPWVIESLGMLADQLNPDDRVAIVVYAGAAGVVLEPTYASDRAAIHDALGRLEAGGSTNGGEGIELAYKLARDGFVEGGINRVVLATDGDWNVGTTQEGDLVKLVHEKAEEQIALTVLGFGMGNYKDDLLETLADEGDGNYAYVDSLNEARRVLVEQVDGTLVTIAKEVKVQVEINPGRVDSYRLIGYENRLLDDEDFEDDTVDGGEIGAGHAVTALYEVIPTEAARKAGPSVHARLRYQKPAELRQAATSDELMTVSLRYQPPTGGRSQWIETPVVDRGDLEPTGDLAYAAALAAAGMLLRDSPHRGTADWDLVTSLLTKSGSRRAPEVARLVEMARELVPVEPLDAVAFASN